MPSPLGHSLIGSAFYAGLNRQHRLLQDLPFFFFIILLSNLPDIDIIFGLLAGQPEKYHPLYTHTLGFTILTGLVLWLTAKVFRLKNPAGLALLGFSLVFLHVLTDTFSYDTRPPVGVMLLWPLTDHYFNFLPIFSPSFDRRSWDVISWRNFWAFAVESIIGGFIILLVFLWKKFTSPRRELPPKDPATDHCPDQKSA